MLEGSTAAPPSRRADDEREVDRPGTNPTGGLAMGTTCHEPRRLSELTTSWEALRRAQDAEDPGARDAQQWIVERYGGAIRRYFLACVGDPDAADDLLQEFGLCLVRGQFRRADPDRGRFRDYLKGALQHLVGRHRRRLARRPWQVSDGAESSESPPAHGDGPDPEFDASWRDDLLARSWSALERDSPGSYLALRLRVEAAGATYEVIAARLSQARGFPVSVDSARQSVRRARARFTERLIDEVAGTLDDPIAERIEDELIDLGLHRYCRPTLGDRVARPAGGRQHSRPLEP